MVQLSCAQSGLSHSPVTHQLYHRLASALPLGMAPLALIVRLATHPHMAASPLHTQPLGKLLCEDLPKGFFTTRTP